MKKLLFVLFSILALTMSKVTAQDAFVGELRLFPYGFTPRNWMSCEGQLLSIGQNTALFILLGTNYGGNGSSTFGLPDLRGYAVMGGGATSPGAKSGTAGNTLNSSQLPSHTHSLTATTVSCNNADGTTNTPGVYAVNTARGNEFNSVTNSTTTNNLTVSTAGNSQPVNNMQPYLVMRWCICVSGIYPPRP